MSCDSEQRFNFFPSKHTGLLNNVMNEQQLIEADLESRRHFLVNFEWMMSVVARYDNPLEFGLVLIEYGEQHALGEACGALQAMAQLTEVTMSLKNSFRKTDIVGRYGSNFLDYCA